MKIGIRTPSLKKSFSAGTTGRLNRAVKKAIIPGYGRKEMGILHPKKTLYNQVYRRTTFSIFNVAKAAFGSKRGRAGNNGCCLTGLFWIVVASLIYVII